MNLPSELKEFIEAEAKASLMQNTTLRPGQDMFTRMFELGSETLFDKLCSEGPSALPPQQFAWNDDTDDHSSWCDGNAVDRFVEQTAAREAALLARIKDFEACEFAWEQTRRENERLAKRVSELETALEVWKKLPGGNYLRVGSSSEIKFVYDQADVWLGRALEQIPVGAPVLMKVPSGDVYVKIKDVTKNPPKHNN